MGIRIKKIIIDNFKSYDKKTEISISDLSVLMGANSSGKSTALQTLLAIKQTMECNSPDIDLLLSGKYVTLGDFDDVINDATRGDISFGLIVDGEDRREDYGDDSIEVMWHFSKGKDIILDLLEFCVSDNNICLKKSEEKHIYTIFVNEKRTALSIELYNLVKSNVYLNYNKEFNNLFCDFLFELFNLLFTKKKAKRMNRNGMVSLNVLKSFLFQILEESSKGEIKLNSRDDDSIYIETAIKVQTLIEKYSLYQNEYFYKCIDIPKETQISLLFIILNACENIDTVNKLLDNYYKEYELFVEDHDYETILYNEKAKLHGSHLDILDDSKEQNILAEVLMSYDELVNEIFGKIFYLGPIREKPQGLYNIGFETIPKYVGTTGAYFASVLLREDKERNFVLPNNEIEHMSLTDALDIWASHLNVANEINVEKNNSFGFSVSIEDTQSRKSDIMNVGIGTSQVIPVLISGLLSDIGEVLIFEQPELHLHPFSQSRLADFFVALVKNGRKVIIETHSEYFLLRLRYQVLMENIKEQDVVVDFFQNKDGTQVSLGKLTGYGGFEYPDDFRDETQQLLDDLMNATFLKRKKHDKCND